MTDPTCTLTYEGSSLKGRVVLPTRTVFFARGDSRDFTADEAAVLDPVDWTGDRLKPAGPPAGSIADVLAWVDGDPERAAQALAAETAGKSRGSLIKQLTELSDGATGTNNEEG